MSSLQDNAIVRFLRETRGEMRKVVWPTRRETINLSFLVIVVSLAMGMFLWLLDLIFERGVGLLVGG
ncbi:MAG: preprotein translocase subunit SecE [Chloroflexi bacterium]|nr:preprotein translocase subunit SecE [Chloroflexota bacterium]MBU1749042.1 preprotein translocase subunit SecE [Chloroflexota bacterium]MBU1878245.1 preprotein translocase subunit SecE [Chloroflexota bacterium]